MLDEKYFKSGSKMQQQLRAPFEAHEIEWRLGTRPTTAGTAVALAYLTARSVMTRLDDVFGIDGWQEKYDVIVLPGGQPGFKCELSVFVPDDVSGHTSDARKDAATSIIGASKELYYSDNLTGCWVTKSDGAPGTDIESFKGGMSDARKRAAVSLGIGRYLYYLPSAWVHVSPGNKGQPGAIYSKTGYWIPPSLPPWALPEGAPGPARALQQRPVIQPPKPTPAPPPAEVAFSVTPPPSNQDSRAAAFKAFPYMYDIPWDKSQEFPDLNQQLKAVGCRFRGKKEFKGYLDPGGNNYWYSPVQLGKDSGYEWLEDCEHTNPEYQSGESPEGAAEDDNIPF